MGERLFHHIKDLNLYIDDPLDYFKLVQKGFKKDSAIHFPERNEGEMKNRHLK